MAFLRSAILIICHRLSTERFRDQSANWHHDPRGKGWCSPNRCHDSQRKQNFDNSICRGKFNNKSCTIFTPVPPCCSSVTGTFSALNIFNLQCSTLFSDYLCIFCIFRTDQTFVSLLISKLLDTTQRPSSLRKFCRQILKVMKSGCEPEQWHNCCEFVKDQKRYNVRYWSILES